MQNPFPIQSLLSWCRILPLNQRISKRKKEKAGTLKYPEESYAFETTITSWKELRSYLNHSDKVVAALFKGKVWAFGVKAEIQNIFEKVLKSDIEIQKFPEDWIQKDYSFVWSLYYDLIKLVLVSKGLICFGRNKFFESKASNKENGNIIYDAVEVFLSCVGGKILLTILPVFYIEKDNGQPMDILEDYKMKQHFIDEKTGISYTLQGDYYLPDLALPVEKETKPIGV